MQQIDCTLSHENTNTHTITLRSGQGPLARRPRRLPRGVRRCCQGLSRNTPRRPQTKRAPFGHVKRTAMHDREGCFRWAGRRDGLLGHADAKSQFADCTHNSCAISSICLPIGTTVCLDFSLIKAVQLVPHEQDSRDRNHSQLTPAPEAEALVAAEQRKQVGQP